MIASLNLTYFGPMPPCYFNAFHCFAACPFKSCCISFRNQSFDLDSKSLDWFLYEMQHWAEMGHAAIYWKAFK